MNIREKLIKFINGIGTLETIGSPEIGLDKIATDYIAALKEFLDGYKVMDTEEWIRTLFCGFLRHSAINNASKTRSVVILDFIDQPTTRRENKLITTARYNQPSCVRI